MFAVPNSGEEVVRQATYLEELERLAAESSRQKRSEEENQSVTSQAAEIVFQSADEVRKPDKNQKKYWGLYCCTKSSKIQHF